MANNFYNINISKYDPANHTTAGQSAVSNPQYDGNNNLINNSNSENNETPNNYSRLNALDSTILINEAYQNIDDDVLKTEYQIDKLESEIKLLDKEIVAAKSINDLQKADILTIRKHTMEKRLQELYKNYGCSDMTTKLSGGIASVFNSKPTFLKKISDNCYKIISDNILSKISKNYNSGQNIKTALNKLEILNKNVDELVTMQMPYGEADERYDMLSEYLNRANVIHFNISKTIGTPTFFDTISSIDKEKFNEVKKNSSNFGNMTNRVKKPSLTDKK